jgi:hypothetical protein
VAVVVGGRSGPQSGAVFTITNDVPRRPPAIGRSGSFTQPDVTVKATIATGVGKAFNRAGISPPLELSGWGTFTGVPSGCGNLGLSVTVNQFTTDANIGAPILQLWDDSGVPAKIGTDQTCTVSVTSSHTDTFTWSGISAAQLATLRVRIIGSAGAAATGAQLAVGWVSMTVDYTNAVPGIPDLVMATMNAA